MNVPANDGDRAQEDVMRALLGSDLILRYGFSNDNHFPSAERL
jgi:hypothetical protein